MTSGAGLTFNKLEDIDVWRRSCKHSVRIYRASSESELSKDWGLRDQIRRASISIPSNIAEGFERDSPAEFKRFLLIAKGSCGELRTQLLISKELKLIDIELAKELIDECIEISSMLQGLIGYLKQIGKR